MNFTLGKQLPRILIIDDSPTSIRLVSHFVRDLGNVHFATSGEAGIALAGELLPDLILLDFEMPGLDGLGTCQRLKQQTELSDIPVIFITAHSSVDHEVAGLAAGAVDFIPKPLSEPIVRARVKTHLTLKRQSDLLRAQAWRDGLTGLYNRRAFDEALATELRRHRRNPASLGLVMLDIDHFKAYNDHYGHQAGDACLQQVATAVASCARRPGETVARYGGEEFAIILPNTEPADCARLCERMAEAVRALALRHEASPAGIVTLSIGYATQQPQDDDASSVLIARADKALYQAKQSGRNRVCSAEECP